MLIVTHREVQREYNLNFSGSSTIQEVSAVSQLKNKCSSLQVMPALLKRVSMVSVDIPLFYQSFFWFNQLNHHDCCNSIKELGLKRFSIKLYRKNIFHHSSKIYEQYLFSKVMGKDSYSGNFLSLSYSKLLSCLLLTSSISILQAPLPSTSAVILTALVAKWFVCNGCHCHSVERPARGDIVENFVRIKSCRSKYLQYDSGLSEFRNNLCIF